MEYSLLSPFLKLLTNIMPSSVLVFVGCVRSMVSAVLSMFFTVSEFLIPIPKLLLELFYASDTMRDRVERWFSELKGHH